MNRTIKLFLSLAFLLLVGGVQAQKMNVKGTVYDTTGTRPIPQALAMAVRMKDSVLLGFTRTDFQGKFELKTFDIDTFTLIISYPGYDDKSYYIFGHADNYEIEIPSVKMLGKSQDLEKL